MKTPWRPLLLGLAGIGILLSGTVRSDELPQGSPYLGDIRRNEQGQLVVVPFATPAYETAPGAVAADAGRPAAPSRYAALASGPSVMVERKPPTCAPQAITCVELLSTAAERAQANVPVTFGQPFKAGDLRKGDGLVARDETGQAVPLQLDQVASRADGSVRFAVVSLRLSLLAAAGRKTVSFFKALQQPEPQEAASAASPSQDLVLRAKLYSPQRSIVTFGDRQENAAGYPFEVGEEVTIQLGTTPDERFTISVTEALAGGSFPTLTKLAEAFMTQINTRSKAFKAYKLGVGGGFEKLWITTRAPDAPAFDIRFIYRGKAKLSASTLQAYAPPRDWIADVRAAIQAQKSRPAPPVLSGAVAREYTLVTPFVEASTGAKHPQLTARVHWRSFPGSRRTRSDIVIENAWAYEPGPGNLEYKLTVVQDGQPVLEQELPTHYHHSRWHHVLWQGEEPQVYVRHHMPYFLSTKVVWNYDLTLPVPEQVLGAEAANLARADTSPMGNAFITTYFPMTGGRADIGPVPRWTALFLVTQDPRARASMLANADAAAGIPIHYRDAPTDQPVNLEQRPGLALLFGRSTPNDAPPAMRNDANPWTVDSAHQGSFAYVPYLVTGDAFYLDEILFWATWNMGSVNPGYRSGGKGLIHADQVRGQAWALRSIGEAARAVPDRHPQKAYFGRKLNDNLEWFVQRYPRNPSAQQASPLGLLQQEDQPQQTAPFTNDFMALVVGQLAQDGDPLAQEFFRWISRFTVGRFLHESDGFCRQRAPGYWFKIRNAAGQLIGSWPELAKTNWPSGGDCASVKLDGYPDSPLGYIANARAMLALAADLQIQGASDAYQWLVSQSPLVSAAMQKDPTWAITPATGPASH